MSEEEQGFIMFDFDTRCGPCGATDVRTPAAFFYKPVTDSWDAVCLDCALVILESAHAAIASVSGDSNDGGVTAQ